ncbi:MAG: 3-phosphoshikimate 1-carboxyvinyltransferase [Lachnospiraceae bacterium]|nr:3-phosphoshikimate 1-carboxyvinyltransferase [Lachnospiraceae bacterium]
MDISIKPGKASGRVAAPPSKSMAHRYLICAALAGGKSKVSNLAYSKDIEATLDCIEGIKAWTVRRETEVEVRGIGEAAGNEPIGVLRSIGESDGNKHDAKADNIGGSAGNDRGTDIIDLNVKESGSTLRFFVPIVLALGMKVRFNGSRTLLTRPLSVYEDICREQGIDFIRTEDSLTVNGKLEECDYSVPGDISSQFITGLLYALAIMGGDKRVHLTTEVASRSYIDLTIEAMGEFGVTVRWEDERTLYIEKTEGFTARDIRVEGDYSNAAFLEALNVIGGDVIVEDLKEHSLQGDRVYREYLRKLKEGKAELDITDCPDLGPVLMGVAAACNGGVIKGTGRLKIKESDRGTVMCERLSHFGVKTEQYEDSIVIHKCDLHAPEQPLDGANDHRIVMTLATLMTITGGTIEGVEAVEKSYPDYPAVLKGLGIVIEMINS